MDRIRDNDCDEEVYRILRMQDEPEKATFEETLQEARDFHDSWSKANPYEVYGGNTFSYCD